MTRCGLALCLALAAACAGSAPPRAVTGSRVLPDAMPARQAMLAEAGRRLYASLRAGDPRGIVLDALALPEVVDAEAASQIAMARARGPDLPPARELSAGFANTTYAGACFDRARPSAPAGEVGLLAPGFLFDRVMVIGRETGGGRVAAWLEGTFVATDAGVWALLLTRVEVPRREHADLDLQACDLRDPPG